MAINITVQIDTPYLSIKEYAHRTEQSVSAVTHQADRGQLPIVTFNEEGKRGKRFINMSELLLDSLSRAGFNGEKYKRKS